MNYQPIQHRKRYHDSDQDDSLQKKPSGFSWLKECAIIVVGALVLSTVIRAFIFQMFWIPSPSMRSTLVENDRIVVSRISAFRGDLERGDVIVFNDAKGWLPRAESEGAGRILRSVGEFIGILPANGEQTLVKRVIGVGGDRVQCCTANGALTVNGQEITEPYIPAGEPASRMEFDVTVPEGSVWVMGDNRPNSADSRFHMDPLENAFIDTDEIVGRATMVLWPLGHWSWLGDRDVFSAVKDS